MKEQKYKDHSYDRYQQHQSSNHRGSLGAGLTSPETRNTPNSYHFQEFTKHKKASSLFSENQLLADNKEDDFVKQVYKMSVYYKKCFVTLRIAMVIFSLLFCTANIMILLTFSTKIDNSSQSLQLSEANPTTNSLDENSSDSYDLMIVFILLLGFHFIEAISNIIETIQINENRFMPTASWLFSLNGCYGLVLFIYVQVIFFTKVYTSTRDTASEKIIAIWLIIEIGGFYISCLQSIIILIVLFNFQKRGNTFYMNIDDENYRKIINNHHGEGSKENSNRQTQGSVYENVGGSSNVRQRLIQ